MSVIAAIRPDDWNFPLLVHVLGAMVLVGGVAAAASSLAFARGEAQLLRLGYWSLLTVALPGFLVMRIGAQWIASKEGLDDLPDDAVPTWLGLGFLIADLGGLVLLVALVLGGIGVWRLREGKGGTLLKITLALSLLLLAAYVVAAWAMAGKPD